MGLRPSKRRRVEVWMFVKEEAPVRLRRRRRDKGLSQIQLAALTGCTQQYISLIEQGRDRDISEKIAERICKYLDVDLEDYFEERVVIRTSSDATNSRGSSNREAVPA
jgi:transcriptional regulator with XRE-family HTH domain